MEIPLESCIITTKEGDFEAPEGDYTAVRHFWIDQEMDLPWYLIMSLALFDSVKGTGSSFLSEYAETLMPRPCDLPQPCCLNEAQRSRFQHPELEMAGREQQDRLRSLFGEGLIPPEATLADTAVPSLFLWAFTCVRSRALALKRPKSEEYPQGQDIFVLAPFLDQANHAHLPNCEFFIDPTGVSVRLVAMKDLKAGDEATISYTGTQGMTNQRLMAQYGFIPLNGNPGDRIDFSVLTDAPRKNTKNNHHRSGACLDGARLQKVIGDERWVEMVRGLNAEGNRLAAVVRSLPVDPGADGSEDESPVGAEEVELANQLLQFCEEKLKEIGGGEMGNLQEEQQQLQDDDTLDTRTWWAVMYRVERKLLLQRAIALMRAYLRVV